jgi:rhodanese-related sulfurtransferase
MSRPPASVPLEISPLDLKRRMDAGEPVRLIDCREPHEYALARIEGAELIPMRAIPGELPRLESLAEEAPLVVYCHHGVRSLRVVEWLRGHGVDACQSMSGGIEAWSMRIDPAVPRYS